MARRKTRSRSAQWLKWTPALAEVFRLASMGSAWTAPASVRVSPGQSRMTLSARFTSADGRVMTARIRLARDHAGEWDVTSEELSIPLGIIRGEAV